jgi:hypothetical protein
MADRKSLLDALERGILTTSKRLRSVSSLARCKDGARRDFLAKEFMKSFEGATLDEFDETLYDFMTGQRPDPRAVQTLIQILIEVKHDSGILTVIESIDARIGGEGARREAAGSTRDRATQDAWWADVILEPFEKSFTKKKIRDRVKTVISDARRQTQTPVAQL